MEKKALGRGLSALIPDKGSESQSSGAVVQVPLSEIKTNRYQPRTDFNQEKLNDLINSIKEKGVVQPVLVRRSPEGYELIAGERRLRAVKALGYEEIPAIVRDVTDLDMLEISLIENIQREELNAIEEAHAFQRFITDFNFTQDRIAQVLGKDRSTVANTIRLLGLPMKIQQFIQKGMLTAGHARPLLSLPNDIEQLRVANLIVKKGFSVRETESLVAKRSKGQGAVTIKDAARDGSITDIESDLQRLFGTRVRIFHGKKRGRIQIEYYSAEDMNRILDLLQGNTTVKNPS